MTAGTILWKLRFSTTELDCATAFRSAASGIAVTVCQREYEQTRSPATGILLANALRQSGDLVAAGALAKDLLSTDARGDALQTEGWVALAQNRTDDAVKLLQDARRWHRERSRHSELSVDVRLLAEIHTQRQQYAEALQLLEESIAEARAGADKRTEAICHLTSARALMGAGYFEAAYEELDRAIPLLSEARDLAVAWQWRGQLEQEVVRGPLHRAHLAQAIAAFEHSLELAVRSQRNTLLVHLHMSLTYSLAELGRVDEAEQHLEEAGLLDRDGHYASHRAQLAARIAWRRGNLTLAYSLNDRAYPNIQDHDDQIDVCVMQARIALATKDLPVAERWARRGVDTAEKVRAAQVLNELRPWVLGSRREPFEMLFTVLARAGRVDEAIRVFDQWQGRTLLEEMASPGPDPSQGLSSTAARIQGLGRWLPAISKAPLMTSDDRAVIQALGKIDLIAFAVAEGDVWRLTASRGRFRLDNLGAFESLRKQLDPFVSAATDPAQGDELGALLLPDDMVRNTDDPLYVVLDTPFADLPVVALRRNGQPVIALRPVVRAPRLPEARSCGPHTAITSAVVLADADGTLPDARRESSKIASRFGATPLVGDAATSTALFAANSEPLLHVAMHAADGDGGGSLKLYDRTVLAPEISANKLGPRLVVLSACSTARSGDPELANSLSAAFLAGGSEYVIATLRPVSDPGALELTSRFYDDGGADDPVHVLARVQAELARSGNQDWPSFGVFASEACVAPRP